MKVLIRSKFWTIREFLIFLRREERLTHKTINITKDPKEERKKERKSLTTNKQRRHFPTGRHAKRTYTNNCWYFFVTDILKAIYGRIFVLLWIFLYLYTF